MGIDLVVLADQHTDSNDFVRLAKLAVEAGEQLDSIGCITFDQRSSALWSAVSRSPFLKGKVQTGAAGNSGSASAELTAVIGAGSASIIAVAELHKIELTHLVDAAISIGMHPSVSLTAFPLEQNGGLSLILPRTRWSPPSSLASVASAQSLIASAAAHLLALHSTILQPEVTKLWVVERQVNEMPSSLQPGVPPTLSVIVPTLDASSERTRQLLASLRKYTKVPYQVILVDNGNSPQGFTLPVNNAVSAARTKYIAIVNDDVRVLEGWWEPLQDALDNGCPIVFPHTLEYTRTDFSAWCFALERSTLQELSIVSGEFFDSMFTIWFQDTDLYLRLQERDEKPHYVCQSRISHVPSTTVTTNDPVLKPWIREQTIVDRDNFIQKWGSDVLAEIGFVDTLERRQTVESV